MVMFVLLTNDQVVDSLNASLAACCAFGTEPHRGRSAAPVVPVVPVLSDQDHWFPIPGGGEHWTWKPRF